VLSTGWNLEAELNATNNGVIEGYVWGTDLSGTMQGAGGVGGLLMVRDFTDLCAAYDGNGNLCALVTDGVPYARYEYGPFGEPIRGSGGVMAKKNPFRFSTKFTDNESGLVYYGFRYYNPTTGRWLCRDRAAENGGLNLYGFVANEPANLADSDGEGYSWSSPTTYNPLPGSADLIAFPNPTTSDDTSAYGLGLSWLLGYSDLSRSFSGNDKLAQQMRSSPEADAARARLKAQMRACCKQGLTTGFNRNLGDEPKLPYVVGFFSDLIHNPTRAFLGSFSGSATVTKCFGGCAVVLFDLHDPATWSSATRLPPPFGYPGSGNSALLKQPWSPIIFLEHWLHDLGQLLFDPNHMPTSILPNNAFGSFGQNVDVHISWQEIICP
jgi:RHS repeat-associated protein